MFFYIKKKSQRLSGKCFVGVLVIFYCTVDETNEGLLESLGSSSAQLVKLMRGLLESLGSFIAQLMKPMRGLLESLGSFSTQFTKPMRVC